MPNLISYAVPVFFVAIAVEAWIGHSRRSGIYRLGSAIADLDAGIASQVVDVFLKLIGLAAYAMVYEHRLVTFPEGSPFPWIIGLVGIDFVYYWWHRASHVVNMFWAVHAVHHQSEDLNLAVALRQPAFEALTIIPFHVPLALIGVDPAVYVACYFIDLIYQFWIHTELVGKLGWLEKLLNTPSSHRVHHGINPKYLDKNFGGILVIWDRIFGTYQPEEELAVYGVTHALASYNPVWANLRRSANRRTLDRGRASPSTSCAHSSLIRHGARSARPRSHRPPCRRAPHFRNTIRALRRRSQAMRSRTFCCSLPLEARSCRSPSMPRPAIWLHLRSSFSPRLWRSVAISTPALGASGRCRASDGRYRARRVVRGGPVRRRCRHHDRDRLASGAGGAVRWLSTRQDVIFTSEFAR